MRKLFNHFFKQRFSSTREKEAKRANAFYFLKAIHEIDDKYIAESLSPFDLKECYREELPISEDDHIKRIPALKHKEVQASKKKNE